MQNIFPQFVGTVAYADTILLPNHSEIEQIAFGADKEGVGSFRPIDEALSAALGDAQARDDAAARAKETGSYESFLDQFDQILDEDSAPDAAFFVESWTLGVATASENLRRRQQEMKIREHEMNARNTFSFPPFIVSGSESFGEVTWPLCEVSASEDCATDSPAVDEESDQRQVVDEVEIASPLTFESACRVLGVEATSSREQIKGAYRKLAIRYHPDRLVRSEAREQKLASDRMACLNEAYHLLCAVLAGQWSASCSR